jgi:hypothetical protein
MSGAQRSNPDPYFHVVATKLLLPGGAYHLDLGSEEAKTVYHTFFAAEVPFLPDLSEHGADPIGREHETLEILQEQIQFIQSVGQFADRDVTFALRFIAEPAESRTRIFLLCKVVSLYREQARMWAQDLWGDIRSSFPRQYPLAPVATRDELTRSVLNPFRLDDVVEIRRREEILPNGAYMVQPLVWHQNSFAQLFHTLASLRKRLMVSVHLKPTELTPAEREDIVFLANRLLERAEQQWTGITQPMKQIEVEAQEAGNAYRALFTQLQQTFLLAVYVASEDHVPSGLVNVLGAELSSPSKAAIDAQEAERPMGRQTGTTFMPFLPRTRADKTCVRRNLYLLEGHLWGPSVLTPDLPYRLERLIHLVDARAANCAFRLPVPPKDGIDGVPLKTVSPFRYAYSARVGDKEALSVGHITRRGAPTADEFLVNVNSLNRHTLVVGTTGSGKTTTCLNLLDQLWRERGIPFLIIEPVKSEYRSLLNVAGFEKLRVFTLGDESTSPLRLNPFEVQEGIRLEKHIGNLKAAFAAVLPLIGPLPMILEDCIYTVYRARGWRLNDDGTRGMEVGFPRLSDLYEAVSAKIDQLDYKGEVRSNIEAASKVRINSLRMGSKGRLLDVHRSLPVEELFSAPTVIELKDISDNDEKALIVGFLLITLNEYCEVLPERKKPGLHHVTLVEEAHRLLRNVAVERASAEEANARGRAVEAFCDMLSEIRAYGEGLVIADQFPTRLAADAVKNTNLKIMHLLGGEDDRKMLGATMNFTEEQMRFGANLKVGQAVVYAEALDEPVLVQCPDYKTGVGIAEKVVSDAEVRAAMSPFWQERREILRPFSGCAVCLEWTECPHLEMAETIARDAALDSSFSRHLLGAVGAPSSLRALLSELARAVTRRTRSGRAHDAMRGVVFCLACCLGERFLLSKAQHVGMGLEQVSVLGRALAVAFAAECGLVVQEKNSETLAEFSTAYREISKPLFDFTDACPVCQAHCLFRQAAEEAARNESFQQQMTGAMNTKQVGPVLKVCKEAATHMVQSSDPESARWAAFCYYLTEMERRGARDLRGLAELFLSRYT